VRKAGATLHTHEERATECGPHRISRVRHACHSPNYLADSCGPPVDGDRVQDYFLAMLACYSPVLSSQNAEALPPRALC